MYVPYRYSLENLKPNLYVLFQRILAVVVADKPDYFFKAELL